MTTSSITFQQGRTDVVTAVLAPMDGISRRPVRSGVDALLWDPVEQAPRPGRLVRSLSGRLVLLNHPVDETLHFRIDPGPAGYRGPLFVTLTPSVDGVMRVVALERRADGPFEAASTLVRGSVVRSAGTVTTAEPAPVEGLTVEAHPSSEAAGHQFPVTTDHRGVFALVVGLTPPLTDEGSAPVTTVLRFEKAGLPFRELDVRLSRGRTHVFAFAVDLDRDEQPPFVHEARP